MAKPGSATCLQVLGRNGRFSTLAMFHSSGPHTNVSELLGLTQNPHYAHHRAKASPTRRLRLPGPLAKRIRCSTQERAARTDGNTRIPPHNSYPGNGSRHISPRDSLAFDPPEKGRTRVPTCTDANDFSAFV